MAVSGFLDKAMQLWWQEKAKRDTQDEEARQIAWARTEAALAKKLPDLIAGEKIERSNDGHGGVVSVAGVYFRGGESGGGKFLTMRIACPKCGEQRWVRIDKPEDVAGALYDEKAQWSLLMDVEHICSTPEPEDVELQTLRVAFGHSGGAALTMREQAGALLQAALKEMCFARGDDLNDRQIATALYRWGIAVDAKAGFTGNHKTLDEGLAEVLREPLSRQRMDNPWGSKAS